MSNKKFKAMPNIARLKLEAIFHPKFENETTDSEIRSKMLAKVAANKGYLEASLKHSGSLLLWSGRQCFYSKNSTSNIFTRVGEIMLLQHFARCYGHTAKNWKEEYQRCSEYVYQNRLTCSFEVVTSILGHHGDIPNRDYLILIAVADRMHGRGKFHSSNELVRFAHQFRLPHNDAWVFASRTACGSLFHAYDTMREVGTATTVMKQLDQIISENEECAKVASLYPHDVFQGDILEGIVIRYVPYYSNATPANDDDGDNASAKQKCMNEMKDLCNGSNEMLSLVPPSTTLDTSSICNNTSIQQVDLRSLSTMDDFEQQLEDVLGNYHGLNLRQLRNENANANQGETQSTATKTFDMVHIANEILSLSSSNSSMYDQETLAIANLINALDQLKVPISYKVLMEKTSASDSDERCLCILHIHHDSSFPKYHAFVKKEGNSGMMLYRGFSIELVPTNDNVGRTGTRIENMDLGSSTAEIESNLNEEKLMLKMKFLPYMVRTFICRNGLSTLQRSGEQSFEDHTIRQLTKWQVSEASVRKWMPFFKGWAKYCSSPPNASLPPLTAQNYLHHYNDFIQLYDNGQFQPDITEQSTFNGLVVVVGRSRDNIEALSLAVSKELHCSKVVRDIRSITDKDVLLSLQNSGGGLLCIAEIEDGFGNLRRLAKQNYEAIYIIILPPDQDELNLLPNKKLRKFNGMLQGWRKTKCNMLFDLQNNAASLLDADSALEYLHNDSKAKEVMSTLKEYSDENRRDERPGAIVYFPSIPGSGKSSLCSNTTSESIGIGDDRQLIMMEGDQVKGKFYNVVRQEILTKPASVAILDKNVPPASFSSVHSLCVESKSIAVPVLFDDMADTLVGSRVYPFTLQHLAVCMSRVLRRQPDTHNGKLDSATDTACMVVVKFYCLYWNMTATVLKERVLNIGHNSKAIVVPFFKGEVLADLPNGLYSVLVDSIMLQTQDDIDTGVVDKDNFLAMEKRLRTSIREHQSYIDNLTVSLDVSKKELASELTRIIASLPEQLDALDIADDHPSEGIKIASLDIDYEDVDKQIEKTRLASPEVDSYFAQREEHRGNDENDKSLNRFIKSSHCTFAHTSQVTQADMISTFQHLLGTCIEVKAAALLFTDNIAAIELEIPTEPSIPRPHNKFHHITIWCANDIEAYESNELLEKVQSNEAKRVLFEKPVAMKGVFSFWYN